MTHILKIANISLSDFKLGDPHGHTIVATKTHKPYYYIVNRKTLRFKNPGVGETTPGATATRVELGSRDGYTRRRLTQRIKIYWHSGTIVLGQIFNLHDNPPSPRHPQLIVQAREDGRLEGRWIPDGSSQWIYRTLGYYPIGEWFEFTMRLKGGLCMAQMTKGGWGDGFGQRFEYYVNNGKRKHNFKFGAYGDASHHKSQPRWWA